MATVTEIRPETAQAKTFRFALPEPADRLAGQHYVVRLTAPDGYTAQRSYSVASPPDGSNEIELTVERLEGGEVSMFLHDDVVVGDELELRGPIGRWFVWEGKTPAVLVGGGSGVVPLMAMLRLARKLGRADSSGWSCPCVLRVTSITHDELPGPESTVVYTRAAPPGAEARRAAHAGRPGAPCPGLMRRRTFAARPGSPTPPATCSSTSACRRRR